MSILEGGGWKSLSPSTSTTICSIHLYSPLCPYSPYIRCAVPAESTLWFIYLKGTLGALAINMRISVLYWLLVCAGELWDLILQVQERAPYKETRTDRNRGQDQLEWRGEKNWKQGNGREGKHQKFKALSSNFSSHWDTAQSSGQTPGFPRPV